MDSVKLVPKVKYKRFYNYLCRRHWPKYHASYPDVDIDDLQFNIHVFALYLWLLRSLKILVPMESILLLFTISTFLSKDSWLLYCLMMFGLESLRESALRHESFKTFKSRLLRNIV